MRGSQGNDLPGFRFVPVALILVLLLVVLIVLLPVFLVVLVLLLVNQVVVEIEQRYRPTVEACRAWGRDGALPGCSRNCTRGHEMGSCAGLAFSRFGGG
jgi:hypothetical protein